mmetsp:Transcript_23948/g.42035  ORF Transcript_23948/g.42035 Transcript_23948/m.42035 type:complete len:187 (+) Transcript_23948:173-733(+)
MARRLGRLFQSSEGREEEQQAQQSSSSTANVPSETGEQPSEVTIGEPVIANGGDEGESVDGEEQQAVDPDDGHDDNVTVVVLESGDDDDEMFGTGWIDQDSPEMQQRRRNVLLRELQRVQRASFIHFMILCLIPTSLLFIVIATVLGEDEECESAATSCEKEPRTFINAFTTRCVCDAITVKKADP